MIRVVVEHRSRYNRQIVVIAPIVDLAKFTYTGWQPHLARCRLVANNNIGNLAPHHKVLRTLVGICRYTNCRTIVAIGEVVRVGWRSEIVTERLAIDIAIVHRVNIALMWRSSVIFVPRLTLADVADHQVGLAIESLKLQSYNLGRHTINLHRFVQAHCVELREVELSRCRHTLLAREATVHRIPTNHSCMVEVGGIAMDYTINLLLHDIHLVGLLWSERNRTIVDAFCIIGR